MLTVFNFKIANVEFYNETDPITIVTLPYLRIAITMWL